MEQRESSKNIVQVDAWVKMLLENARDKYGISVDPSSPTREACLDAAVAMHNLNQGVYSREIMSGKRIDGSSNESYILGGLWQIFERDELQDWEPRETGLRYFYSGIHSL